MQNFADTHRVSRHVRTLWQWTRRSPTSSWPTPVSSRRRGNFWTQGLIVAQNLSDKTFSHCMSFHFIACHSTLSIKWCFRSFCFILNAFCVLTELALYMWVFLDSEVAMWLHWFHCGRLTGDAIVTDMLFVSVERFREAGTVTMWDRMRLDVTDLAGHPANAHFERRAFVCPTLCFACLACRTPGCHA